MKQNLLAKTLQDLTKENEELKQKLDKIKLQCNTQISIIKRQPSPNKYADAYFIARLKTILSIIEEGDKK